LDAIDNISTISNERCYEEGKKYDMNISYPKYIEFFNSLYDISGLIGEASPELSSSVSKCLEQQLMY
jgi:hypothetical protein